MQKPTFALIILLFPFCVSGQPDFESLQREWLQKITASTAEELYWKEGSLLFWNSTVTELQEFRTIPDGQANSITYHQKNIFEHDQYRYITTGSLKTGTAPLFIVSGWRKTQEDWKKEIDIVLTQHIQHSNPDSLLTTLLDTEHKQWVALANNHDPQTHIGYSYAPDAVYFSNGRRSDGTSSIAERYGYMKNPGYRVDLEKLYLHQVSDQHVLEVGRYYAGERENNPGGLYIILWEKSVANQWKIVLDFNF